MPPEAVSGIDNLFTNRILTASYAECRQCLDDVSHLFSQIVQPPSDTPSQFQVVCRGVPPSIQTPQRNLFSTLFHSVYFLMNIPLERRLLYGRINYLFRVWVTSADNLLDAEDKLTVEIVMPHDSRVMRQVVAIMAADRVLTHLIREAFMKGALSAEGARALIDGTLQVLLPSAAEEASEEGGVKGRPPADYVLHVIHRLKTQLLFHVPLLGPERVEDGLDRRILDLCREGLGRFGLGCQLLDDMRDLSRDWHQKRHNYILSLVRERYPDRQSQIDQVCAKAGIEAPVHDHFIDIMAPVAGAAFDELTGGLTLLDQCGLGLAPSMTRSLAAYMFKALDVESAFSLLERRS